MLTIPATAPTPRLRRHKRLSPLKAQTVPVTVNVQKTQMVPCDPISSNDILRTTDDLHSAPTTIIGPLTTTHLQERWLLLPTSSHQPVCRRTGHQPVVLTRTEAPLTVLTARLYRSNSHRRPTGLVANPAASTYPTVTPRPDRITSNNSGWKPVQATLAKIASPE